MKSARAVAHSNIALVKYWGKRVGSPPALNLPEVGSLSMTLDDLRTETTIAEADSDLFELDGERLDGEAALKVFAHIDRVYASAQGRGTRPCAWVRSTNHLPTAAGLASSASGFAALTVAAAAAFGGPTEGSELSALARQGSGSAARSIWGGFVRLDRGLASDGSDCIARPLFGPEHWPLRMIVVHTARGAKPIGSSGGMERCRETSPYYPAWVESHRIDLDEADTALRDRDLERLGGVVERSCFKMHACMWATQPPLVYWNGITLEVIRAVWDLRAHGTPGFVTSDAGPHVKVLTTPEFGPILERELQAVPGVHRVESVGVGPAARAEVLS